MNPSYVSVHGGHSGQFCIHARDRLEDIVKTYISHGFYWVGLTEHMPPVTNDLRYPDEKQAKLSSEVLFHQFLKYIKEARRLQKKYADQITLYVGMETETCTGSQPFLEKLIQQCQPDYIVGSVHHVNDMCIDFSKDHYTRAAEASGGIDALYLRYFDTQYKMIQGIEPSVIGHFDLIRLHDPDYKKRMKKNRIWEKILRNLELIKEKDLILDFNLRALYKGADEPYISADILRQARALGIKVAPGDDSHGKDNIGLNIDRGIHILRSHGFDLPWPVPKRYNRS